MILKRIYLITILFFSLILIGISCKDSKQDNNDKIDVLLEKCEYNTKKLNYRELIKYAKDAESLALETNNDKKLDKIYLYMADGLSGLRLQKECFYYLNKIVEKDFEKKDKILQAKVYQLYAYNYHILGMGNQNLEYNEKVVNILSSAKTNSEIFLLAKSYGALCYYYYGINDMKSSRYYHRKWEQTLRRLPESETVFEMVDVIRFKGYSLLGKGKAENELAMSFFKDTYKLKKKYNHPNFFREYASFGDYYYTNGDKKTALEYYLIAEKISKKENFQLYDNYEVNRTLESIYEEFHNTEKQIFYLKKNIRFNDSLKVVFKNNREFAVGMMMGKKVKEISYLERNYILFISTIFVVIIIGGSFLYHYLKKRNSEKTKKLLIQKENMIHEKEVENLELKQKVNESFDEVIKLAKDNNPEFLTRFQEIYPEFYQKLSAIEPKLLTTETKLCATMFLGFSTKDISEYEFVTVKAVQHRKFRLRKKLNIPSDLDIITWINFNL